MSDVMKKVIEGIKWFFTNPRYVYCLGLVITIVATFLEMMRSHAYNYYDYQNATMMFWGGMDPYTVEFAETHSISSSILLCSVYSSSLSSYCPTGWDRMYGTSCTTACSPLPSGHCRSR